MSKLIELSEEVRQLRRENDLLREVAKAAKIRCESMNHKIEGCACCVCITLNDLEENGITL